MGKASKWFRALLGLKKSDPNPNTYQIPHPPKKIWSFAKYHKVKGHQKSQHGVVTNDNDHSHHAVAVAAATAAVAEAAVAAAQAAAVVVQLTRGTGRNTSTVPGSSRMSTAACVSKAVAGRGSRKNRAAVTIQSHFRAYLSRRALRALKALVKLQALVRGHLLRKQTADVLRRMQALVRSQARARAGRFLISDSPYTTSLKSSHFSYHGPPTPEKIEHVGRTRSMKHEQLSMLKRNGSRSSGIVSFDAEKLPTICNRIDCRLGEKRSREQGLRARSGPMDDEINLKILEVDTGKPHYTPKCKTIFYASHPSLGSDLNCQSFSTSKDSTVHQTVMSSTSGEVQSLSPLKFAQDIDGLTFCTADNSPQFFSASSMGGSSKRGAFTPSKSDGSRSCLNGYTDNSNPNYMSYTESSKAKARSLSAPKQRLQYDKSGCTKRYSVHGCHESMLNAHTQRVSALHTNFTNKAYPGSGRLDRLGMPVGVDVTGSGCGHWPRY